MHEKPKGVKSAARLGPETVSRVSYYRTQPFGSVFYQSTAADVHGKQDLSVRSVTTDILNATLSKLSDYTVLLATTSYRTVPYNPIHPPFTKFVVKESLRSRLPESSPHGHPNPLNHSTTPVRTSPLR